MKACWCRCGCIRRAMAPESGYAGDRYCRVCWPLATPDYDAKHGPPDYSGDYLRGHLSERFGETTP